MNIKHLDRIVAAAMSAATTGAVALPAANAQAEETNAATALQINWSAMNLAGAGDPMFAEYHQGEYVRVMDQLSNWGILTKSTPVTDR